MKRKIIFVLLLYNILILFLISCRPDERSTVNPYHLRGAGCYYVDFPSWCGDYITDDERTTFEYNYDSYLYKRYCDYDYSFCLGYSNWKDWQSEEGKKLHDYVSSNLISDYYEGKYRVILFGQDVMLGFNDKKGTVVNILYNWVGYGICSKLSVKTHLIGDNKIEYDCNAVNRLTERKESYNKSHVVITKLEDEKYNYNQTINGETVFNVELKRTDFITNVVKPNWYPNHIDGINGFDPYICHIAKQYQIAPGYATLSMMEYDYPTYTIGNVLSLEGFKLRNQDDENMTISFDFLDADKGGLADYVEIHRKDEDFVNITFYKDGKIVRQHKNLSCYDY